MFKVLELSVLLGYYPGWHYAKGTITAPNTASAGAAVNNTNKKVIFKNCAPFTNCITEINNTQVDDTYGVEIVMPMYSLIEYSDPYPKTSWSL